MKQVIAVVVTAVLSISLYAQDSPFYRSIDETTGYGIRVGTNVSSLDFKNDTPPIDNTHRNGAMVAFFLEFPLGERIVLSPELQYSAEGSKDERLRLDLLGLPVLFKFYLFEDFSVNLGPQVNLKIHEFEDNYTNFTFSGVGGLQFGITPEIFVDFRYSYGFTNVFDKETGLDAINNTFQIGIGYKL